MDIIIKILMNVVVPIFVAAITAFLVNFFNRKQRKAELEKLNSEIGVLKHRFQPVVIETLIKTHELLIEDKINALRELLDFKEKLLKVDVSYQNGRANVEDFDEYYDVIYEKIGDSEIAIINSIIVKYGYLFRDDILEAMHKLSNDLSRIYHIQKERFSMSDRVMPEEALGLVSLLSNRFNNTIEAIREDLHINDDFIHKFINSYKSYSIDKTNKL